MPAVTPGKAAEDLAQDPFAMMLAALQLPTAVTPLLALEMGEAATATSATGETAVSGVQEVGGVSSLATMPGLALAQTVAAIPGAQVLQVDAQPLKLDAQPLPPEAELAQAADAVQTLEPADVPEATQLPDANSSEVPEQVVTTERGGSSAELTQLTNLATPSSLPVKPEEQSAAVPLAPTTATVTVADAATPKTQGTAGKAAQQTTAVGTEMQARQSNSDVSVFPWVTGAQMSTQPRERSTATYSQTQVPEVAAAAQSWLRAATSRTNGTTAEEPDLSLPQLAEDAAPVETTSETPELELSLSGLDINRLGVRKLSEQQLAPVAHKLAEAVTQLVSTSEPAAEAAVASVKPKAQAGDQGDGAQGQLALNLSQRTAAVQAEEKVTETESAVLPTTLAAEAPAVRELALRVDPPSMGPITIRVHEQNSQVFASVVVQHAPVGTALRQAESQVRAILEGQGLQMGGFEVAYQGGGSQQQQSQNLSQPASWEASLIPRVVSQPAETTARPTRTVAEAQALVDVYV